MIHPWQARQFDRKLYEDSYKLASEARADAEATAELALEIYKKVKKLYDKFSEDKEVR